MKFLIQLEVKSDKGTHERSIQIEEGKEFILGRESENSQGPYDPKEKLSGIEVSRKHCALTVKKGQLFVSDTGSRNGTYLNYVQITNNRVEAGDIIQIGNYEILVKAINKVHEPLKVAEAPAGKFESTAAGETKTQLKLQQKEEIEVVEKDLMDPSKIRLKPAHLPQILLRCFFQARRFFQSLDLEGSSAVSLATIFVCALVSAVVNPLGFHTFVPEKIALMAAGIFGAYVVFAVLLYLLRLRLNIDATISNFFRFFAFISLVGAFLSVVSYPFVYLAPVFQIAFFLWMVHGVVVAFKAFPLLPHLFATIGIAVWCLSWVSLLGISWSSGELVMDQRDPQSLNRIFEKIEKAPMGDRIVALLKDRVRRPSGETQAPAVVEKKETPKTLQDVRETAEEVSMTAQQVYEQIERMDRNEVRGARREAPPEHYAGSDAAVEQMKAFNRQTHNPKTGAKKLYPAHGTQEKQVPQSANGSVAGGLEFKDFIGDFRKGETFDFWFRISGKGYTRDGTMKLTVKDSDPDSASFQVTGTLDAKNRSFDHKVKWKMDWTSISSLSKSSADLKHITLENIVDVLISHRMGFVLMSSTPVKQLPKSLQNPRGMSVAGLTSQFYKNWAPSRTIAEAHGGFDVAVSPEYGIPLFVSGKATIMGDSLYITLKSYHKP